MRFAVYLAAFAANFASAAQPDEKDLMEGVNSAAASAVGHAEKAGKNAIKGAGH